MRLFDFTLLRHSHFTSYGDTSEIYGGSEDIWYRQRVNPGHAAYTRGYQIIRPRDGYEAIRKTISDRRFSSPATDYVEFIAHDWRNDQVVKISTDPAATTNYFEAENNDLPFEVSPAFFQPDVLLKYHGDAEKYTVNTRRISCRAAWELESYDVNEAGQVHAYIRYLRRLPYKEQLHWLSHNEQPKAPISERALRSDMHGQFHEKTDPLDDLKSKLRRLHERRVAWWALGSEDLLDQAFTPRTNSRDDWAEAFLRVAKLVNEGLVEKKIKQHLKSSEIYFETTDRSIKLLERLWSAKTGDSESFSAMRGVQAVRSKVRGHRPTTEGAEIAPSALSEHGSYTAHFEATCENLVNELAVVSHLFEAQ